MGKTNVIGLVRSRLTTITPHEMNDQKFMWTQSGTALLISVWSSNVVQKQLQSTLRNQPIWDGVASYLTKKGYRVNGKQCRTRIKNILVRYREARKNGSVSGSGIESFYHDIDRVMASKTNRRNFKVTTSHIPVTGRHTLLKTVSMQSIVHQGTSHTNNFEKHVEVISLKNEQLNSLAVSDNESQEVEDLSDTALEFFETIDNDQSSSSAQLTSATANKSCLEVYQSVADQSGIDLNSTQTKEPDNEFDPRTQDQVPSSCHQSCRIDGLHLEQLITHAVQVQGEAVTKILATQSEMFQKLLEADRQRQNQVERRLDKMLDILERLLPTLVNSSMNTPSPSHDNDCESRLTRLLDRLERVLPFVTHISATSKQAETDKQQREILTALVEKIDKAFPNCQTETIEVEK